MIALHADLLTRLTDHLHDEEAVLQATLECLAATRESLLENNLDGFSESLGEQVEHNRKADELQNHRNQLLHEVGRELQIESTAISLRDIAERLPNESGEALQETRQRLQQLITEIKKYNLHNALLIRQSVDLTREVLAHLTKEELSGDVYDSAGAKDDSLGRHSMFEIGG